MKKRIKLFVFAVALSFFSIMTPVVETAYALDPFKGCSGSSSTVCKGQDDSLMPILENIINTLLLLVGIIAVIVIIISGIRFITSDGDANKVASARNGVIYSVVGLAVAIMAYAIVRFVVNSVA